MLDGIEVLNKVEITEPSLVTVVFLIGFLVSLVFVIVSAFLDYYNTTGAIACFIAVLCWIGVIVCGEIEVPTGEYEYQVTIDDTVSATSLYENYEVIDQQGKIWTIRLKEE